MLAQHISTTFRDACTFRGLSTRQAAAVLEISQKAVHNLINGHTWPDLPMIARVEGKLGIQLWTSQYNAGSARAPGAPAAPLPRSRGRLARRAAS